MGGGSGMFNAALGRQAQDAAAPSAKVGSVFQGVPQATPYAPQFSAQMQQMSPLVQQQMAAQQAQQMQQTQQMQPLRGIGAQQYPALQGLLNQVMARYNPQQFTTSMQPAPQQPMMQMPAYRSPALNYNPNMQGAQQNLGRVAKSVVLQQKEAAEAEAARLKAELEAAQQQQSYYDYGGGGG
jgi:hypothetical protein